MKLNNGNLAYIGMFGFTTNAGIENVTLENVDFTGGQNVNQAAVGAVVGMASTGTVVQRCRVTGSITGATNDTIGGIVGSNGATVKFCSSAATITAGAFDSGSAPNTGGIVGSNWGGTIQNCSNTGSVSSGAGTSVGGIVGFCYSTGNTVSNCCSTGTVTGPAESSGAIIGKIDAGTTFTASSANYYLNGSAANGTGTASASGLTASAETAENLKLQSTYSGWDFSTNAWLIQSGKNNGYPFLKGVATVAPTGAAASISATGATLSGNVTAAGDGTVTERGIRYLKISGGASTKTAASSTGLGEFSVSLTGLEPVTQYCAMAYAVNEVGTAYGEPIYFSTTPKLSMTVSPGSVVGATRAVISDTVANHFVVNVTDTATGYVDAGNAAPTTGANLVSPYVSGNDITTGVAVGKYLQVYNVDSNGKIVNMNEIQLNTGHIKSADLTLPYSEGFDSGSGDWIEQNVTVTSPVTMWSYVPATNLEDTSSTPVAPRTGANMAKADFYNCGSDDGSLTTSRLGLAREIALPANGTYNLSFYMYHSSTLNDTGLNDAIQPQISTDGGITWNNLGPQLLRTSGSGWVQHTISLNANAGNSVRIGFLGISDYGYSVFLDDINVVSLGPVISVTATGTTGSTYGSTDSRSFSIADSNFTAVPTAYTAEWCNADGTTTNAPSAGTLSVGTVTDGDATLTLTPSATADAGTHYFKVSSGDTSTVTAFTISKADAASAMKTAAATVPSSGKTGATVTLPTLPTGASYGTPAASGTITMTGMSISGTTLTFTAPASTAGQTGAITVPVSGAKNYNDYSITVTITSVAKTAVTITGLTAANGSYSGSAVAGYSGTPAGYAGTLNNTYYLADGMTKTTAANSGAASDGAAPVNAGGYRLTVSVPESDETYTGSVSVDFTIAPKELTVTGLSAVNRAYNGSTAVALTGGALAGVIGSDDVSTTMPTAGIVAAAGAGNAKAVTVVKPSLTGTAAANYTLANLPAVTVNISPAVITVTGAGSVAVTKPYDGTAAAGTLSGTPAFSGKVGTEDVSVSATPGAYAANAVDAGTGKTVELTLSLTGNAIANYTLASSAYSFTDAAITKGTYSGSAIQASLSVPVGDSSTGTISASTFALPGSLKNAAVVSVSEVADADSILTLTGNSYSVSPTADTQSASCTVVISSDNYSDVTAALSFTPANKVLAGIAVKTAPTKTSYIVGNKFDPAGLVLTLTYKDNSTREVAYSDATKAGFTFSPAADTALAKSVTAVSISYGGKTTSQAITVSDKHKISIQWKELYNLVYDGTAKHPTLAATGILSGADVAVALDAASKAHSAAGSYTAAATLSGADAADYTIVNPSVVFTIQKAPVTVTVSGDTVAKGAAISTAVTATPSVGVTLSYRDSSGNTVTPTSSSAGTYDIYAAISDANYRFSDATDGAAKKVGVLTVYDTKPAEYAVTFSGGVNASGTVAPLTAAQAGTIRTMPANSYTKTAAKFTGWTYAGKVYQPGDTFSQPAAEAVVTATWQNLYGIGGTVLQDGSAVSGAVVTLMLSNTQIAQSITDASGNYTFSNVTPGLYNLVAAKDGITQTSAVKIAGSSVNNLTITLPSGKTNTIVEVVAGTPDIVVGGLDNTVKNPTAASKVYTAADKTTVDAGGSVDVKLTADVNNNAGNQTTINQSAVKAADVTIGLFLDFGIKKTVKDSDGVQKSSSDIIETDDLIELTIDIPASLQGAKNYVVYRLHEGAVQELRTTPNAAGEYIVINSNNTITVYAKYFSVYGLGYTTVLDIAFDGNGGTASTAAMTTDTSGKLAALPTATRSGYTFGGWYTEASGGTQITTGTVFTKNTTAYAHWTASGSTPGGSGGGVTSTYSVTAPAADNGSVKLGTSSAAGGTKVTVTVTPDSGYTLRSLTIKDAGGNTVSYTDNKNGTYTFTMPASAVTVSADFAKTAVFPFTDVPETYWARAGIAWAYENGIFTGTDAASFSPELSTSRGMIATVLWRIESKPAPASADPFGDVLSGRYYAQAVAWAAEKGVVKGYSASSYGPEDDITREQLAAILYRYAKYRGYDVSKGESTSLLAYTDAGSVSAYALPAMRWAVGAGLIEGSESKLLPGAHATRAQVAAILQRFAQSFAK